MSSETMKRFYKECSLCPRSCHVDRTEGKIGVCGETDRIRLARAALHYWEEPCISGDLGSGTVFFSGCNLGCVFCQNASIASGTIGYPVSESELADIFLSLQDQGALNINLVTATHYIPSVVEALSLAKDRGLILPIVYNTGGYDSISSLRLLDGLVDVYLPDYKYVSEETSKRFSHCSDYPLKALLAIEEMVRQAGTPVFVPASSDSLYENQKNKQKDTGTYGSGVYEDNDSSDPLLLIKKGVIVRHLVLPDHYRESREALKVLKERFGDRIWISLMSQYTPLINDPRYPELSKRIRLKAYDALVDYCIDHGMEQVFIQDGESAKESFIPAFDGTGIL